MRGKYSRVVRNMLRLVVRSDVLVCVSGSDSGACVSSNV